MDSWKNKDASTAPAVGRRADLRIWLPGAMFPPCFPELPLNRFLTRSNFAPDHLFRCSQSSKCVKVIGNAFESSLPARSYFTRNTLARVGIFVFTIQLAMICLVGKPTGENLYGHVNRIPTYGNPRWPISEKNT